MDIPQLYLDSSESIKHVIINLGTTCFNKIFSGKTDNEIITLCSQKNSNVIEEIYEKEIKFLKKND